jgi:hypothetical protein
MRSVCTRTGCGTDDAGETPALRQRSKHKTEGWPGASLGIHTFLRGFTALYGDEKLILEVLSRCDAAPSTVHSSPALDTPQQARCLASERPFRLRRHQAVREGPHLH